MGFVYIILELCVFIYELISELKKVLFFVWNVICFNFFFCGLNIVYMCLFGVFIGW